MNHERLCPDCCSLEDLDVNRRRFVQTVGAVAGASLLPRVLPAAESDSARTAKPETLVKQLYDSMTPDQQKAICFPWDYEDARGLLRTRVQNNWSITDPKTQNVGGSFYSKVQQELIEALFFSLYNPEWHDRIRTQLHDDAGGYGKQQTIAIFGKPGEDKFEFVMTGRHLTIRCDGNSTEHMAFGGPIFYGHAARNFNEDAQHTGNVYWHQALKANELYQMLDGKQRSRALVPRAPEEDKVAFRDPDDFQGIRINELADDQKAHVRGVLDLLLEPYRSIDRDEAMKCLNSHGGLDACRIAFYQNNDIGDDGVWDNWRLEGPTFVWHYRGAPHVHVWVNISDSPDVKLNAKG
ncbi:DUF3500 domain-containing protein [bacterium]|nr:DUF3500 domain-containing protein [bacterium]